MKTSLLILLFWAPLASSAEVLTGVAKDQNGDIAYLERHEIGFDETGLNKSVKVEYSKPDGSIFATMTSEFSNSKTLPETTFEDRRFRTKFTMRIVGARVEFEEYKDNKSIAKKYVPYDQAMVASQGFDNFMKMNLSDLTAQPLKFQFGVLEAKDFFTLIGQKISATNNDVEFRIRASSWFVRLFAKELYVVYDAKNRIMKSFSGRSNIPNDFGQAQDVFITYQRVLRK